MKSEKVRARASRPCDVQGQPAISGNADVYSHLSASSPTLSCHSSTDILAHKLTPSLPALADGSTIQHRGAQMCPFVCPTHTATSRVRRPRQPLATLQKCRWGVAKIQDKLEEARSREPTRAIQSELYCHQQWPSCLSSTAAPAIRQPQPSPTALSPTLRPAPAIHDV